MKERVKEIRRTVWSFALRLYLAPLRRRFPGGLVVGVTFKDGALQPPTPRQARFVGHSRFIDTTPTAFSHLFSSADLPGTQTQTADRNTPAS